MPSAAQTDQMTTTATDGGGYSSSSSSSSFQVSIFKENQKFSAAHFVAFPGFRERLHGHNYHVSVRLLGACGSGMLGGDGYLMDFGPLKELTRHVCDELDEFFLCPVYSDVLQLEALDRNGESLGPVMGVDQPPQFDSLQMTCEDGTHFIMPRQDIVLLPIVHATTEELAVYIWNKLVGGLGGYWQSRNIETLQVTVTESPGQQATFSRSINEEVVDVRSIVSRGEIVPLPCLPVSSKNKKREENENVLRTPLKEETKSTERQSQNGHSASGCAACQNA